MRMMGTSAETQTPFWEDDPLPYRLSGREPLLVEKGLAGLTSCIRILEILLLFGIVALFARKYTFLWTFMAALACLMAGAFLLPLLARRRGAGNPQARASRIQQLAKERTGSELMGSALHTRGHPLLQRNQPVVLGLRGDELSIRSYANPEPIDVINARDIQGVQTIVLDEDLIAHTDVVDATAQAFQISVSSAGTDYTCSFRRLYKVRAIEWYRALEAARLGQR